MFRDCAECPEMVVVPPGEFTMGIAPGETESLGWVGSLMERDGAFDRERPQHKVTLARPFAVGRYEITRAEFEGFVKETGHNLPKDCRHTDENSDEVPAAKLSWQEPGFLQSGRDPVVCVSWEDAKAYTTWLSAKTGQPYRLLTEAEWEYATRAGIQERYYFGPEISGVDANHADTRDGDVYRKKTQPVGTFLANAFGLYDVHGNAWEWVEDCWHEDYHGAPSDGSEWSVGDCEKRVIRGGSWASDGWVLRSAFRYRFEQSLRFNTIGFRVGRSLN